MFVSAALFAGTGCADIAGLEEHKPYPGMPDSTSMRCSDGTNFVSCDDVRTTAPQDGNTLITEPLYQLSGSDVVDVRTGLSWSTITGPKQDHAAAADHCNQLGGPYRLPSRIELVTLLDFSQERQTRINTKTFTNVQPMPYWTNSVYNKDSNFYWTVDFDGNSSSEYTVVATFTTNKAGVLCVKDDVEPFAPGSFVEVDAKALLVRDTRTGLVWIKKPIRTSGNWMAALQDCRDARNGSYSDFRTANVKELSLLVDDSVAGPTTLGTLKDFDIEFNQTIWASTPSHQPDFIHVLNTSGGSISKQEAKNNSLWTMCVRGPD